MSCKPISVSFACLFPGVGWTEDRFGGNGPLTLAPTLVDTLLDSILKTIVWTSVNTLVDTIVNTLLDAGFTAIKSATGPRCKSSNHYKHILRHLSAFGCKKVLVDFFSYLKNWHNFAVFCMCHFHWISQPLITVSIIWYGTHWMKVWLQLYSPTYLFPHRLWSRLC